MISENLPLPLFTKEGNNASPFEKGGLRGILCYPQKRGQVINPFLTTFLSKGGKGICRPIYKMLVKIKHWL